MYSNIGVKCIVLLAALNSTCFAQTEHYIGKTIDSLVDNTSDQWLSRDEFVALVSDNILVGESASTKWFGVYYKKYMHADGRITLKIYSKGSDKLLKEITDKTWSVQPDGTWCTIEDDVRHCDKKVYKIGNTYVSVLKKNGKINGFWSVENGSDAAEEH